MLATVTVQKGKYSKRIFLNMNMHTLSIQGNSMGIQVSVMPRHSRITLYESSQFFHFRPVYSWLTLCILLRIPLYTIEFVLLMLRIFLNIRHCVKFFLTSYPTNISRMLRIFLNTRHTLRLLNKPPSEYRAYVMNILEY